MILKEFSKYIQSLNAEVPTVILLSRWIRERLSKTPENNVDKILHAEIVCLKNKRGMFLLLGRSDSGRKLLESLYEYALSYDNHKFSKWVHKLKASDFK